MLVYRIAVIWSPQIAFGEINLIIVQQDATVFSLLYFYGQLSMFRVIQFQLNNESGW